MLTVFCSYTQLIHTGHTKHGDKTIQHEKCWWL